MDDQRIGRAVRALRRRLEWRQLDLARKAHCAQSTISLIERGQLGHASMSVVRRVVAALDASIQLEIRWRGAGLDRLLDEDHAALVAAVARFLSRHGWEVRVEVTYSEYGERGSYDILAFHAATQTLLVVEIKTDLPSAEATVRKLDEKTRLATKVARDAFGWRAQTVSRILVMPDASTLRRRIERHAELFDRVLPVRGADVRAWLRQPTRSIAGRWFLSSSDPTARIAKPSTRERVRRRIPPLPNDEVAA